MKIQRSFQNNNAKLYLVATPIGNLKDITIRAIETLKMVDYIYCEDTRNSIHLLNEYQIKAPLRSYHTFNDNEVTDSLIKLVKDGSNVAIITDAGLPSISDPGYLAAVRAIEEDVDVVIIPGATAGVSALVASGMNTSRYMFIGFLNSKKSQRVKELEELKQVKDTLIFYEAPHRIKETLQNMLEVFGDRYICIARELTKIHEEYLRGNISEVIEVDSILKGEMVLIVSGNSDTATVFDDISIIDQYNNMLKLGINHKEAMKKIAEVRNIKYKEVYKIVEDSKNK